MKLGGEIKAKGIELIGEMSDLVLHFQPLTFDFALLYIRHDFCISASLALL
jgi:hypothetical protein